MGRAPKANSISRRNFLLNIGLPIPLMAAMPRPVSAESPFKSFQLVISDIATATPPDGLLAVMKPFVTAGIPVSCMVSLGNDNSALQPDSKLAEYLRGFVTSYAAQIEVVIDAPMLIDRPYYFQARHATQARRRLEDGLLTAQQDDHRIRALLTVGHFGAPTDYEPGGVRAAGYRTVLSLPRSGVAPVDSRWDQGVLHIFGGMHFGLADPFATIRAAVSASVRDDRRSLLILSVAGLDAVDSDAAASRMTEIASMISRIALTGQIVPTNPSDFHVSANPSSGTAIGLRLDVDGGPDDPAQAQASTLAHWLRDNNIGFTVAGPDASVWQGYSTDLCPLSPQADDQTRCRDGYALEQNAATRSSLPPGPAATARFPTVGVDHLGTLHPPRLAIIDDKKSAEDIVSGIHELADTILVLDQNAYASVAQRQKTTTVIQDLVDRYNFEVDDVASFTSTVRPMDSICLVYRQTENVMRRERPELATSEPTDRDGIKGDAELAWCYFKIAANPLTGMIPSTVLQTSGTNTTFDYATMWDIGSQLFGMIAAVRLDLMSLSDLDRWARTLIENLPTITVQGLKLPSSIVHVRHQDKPDPSFNSCDVGRLLSALHSLRIFSPGLKEIVDRKVAAWDLKDTFRNGRPHDLTAHHSYDRFGSHCTDYAAKGYQSFQIAAGSPYRHLNGGDDTDAVMDLLFNVSEIGSIGAEPLLLDVVEFGFTPTTQYLADMLFAAQLADHLGTGTMRCVSEGPLNKAPWFSYQGYNINGFAAPWDVQVLSNDRRFKDPAFLRAIEVVSVKSAYLWAATYPHPYSRALRDYVRGRARIENLGFSSGIFLQTGRPMKDYSDLNTNGIILEAAAHILA